MAYSKKKPASSLQSPLKESKLLTTILNEEAKGSLSSLSSNIPITFSKLYIPTQPQMMMSPSDPKYIIISTEWTMDQIDPVIRVLNYHSDIPGYDLAVSITNNANNVTYSLNADPGSSYAIPPYSQNAFPIPSANSTNPALIKFTVKWSSGFERIFDIIFPGALNRVLKNSDEATLSTNNCVQNYVWNDMHKINALSSLSDRYYTGFTRPISDPAGKFADWAGTYKLSDVNPPIPNTSDYYESSRMADIISHDFYGTPVSPYPEPGAVGEQYLEVLLLGWGDDAASQYTVLSNNILSLNNTDTYSNQFSGILMNSGVYANSHTLHSTVMYAYNLPLCSVVSVTIDGCNDPNNMNYWGYTYADCAGVSIPANVITNPSIATFTPGSCCPDCINPLGKIYPNIIYSPNPLTFNVQGADPTTIGGTDGYIDVTVLDGGFDSSGVPQGLITGVANYTFVVQNTLSSDTMCGNTAGLGVGSGAVTNNSFTFGKSILGTNVNGGLLQTGAAGSATYAASAAQGYVPGGTSTSAPYGLGTANTEGFREGTYMVYVFDASSTVCLASGTVVLADPPPSYGCTDNSALNYDSSATNNNGTCEWCNENTGYLVDSGNVFTDEIVSGPFGSIYNATTSVSTDGHFFLGPGNTSPSFQTYINNIVDANGTQNAEYKIELHRHDLQTSTAYLAWDITNGTDLTAFNAGTTQVGSTITNAGGSGWAGDVNSFSVGANFTYGYYSVKLYVNDPDDDPEQDECYKIIDFYIQVPCCVDNGVATSIDGVVISDPGLYYHEPNLCAITNNFCCDTPTFSQTASSLTCNQQFESTITCSPAADSIVYQLEFDVAGSWVAVGNGAVVPFPGPSYTTGTILSNANTQGFGQYRVVWTSTYANGTTCDVISNVISWSVTYGCMDPSALNYNSTATCDDGSCLYCFHGCTDSTASNYNSLATCDDGSCIYPVYGCTDITASNYNPLANIDDGSCQYLHCGCTDPLAYNYGYNILGTLVGTPPTCDDGNCQYCDDPPLIVSSVVTGTTLVSSSGCLDNCDGTIELTATSTTSGACTSYTIVSMYMFCGICNCNIEVISNQSQTTGTQTISGVCSATWTFILEDCFGCQMQVDIAVPGPGGPCGCTDPAADNYSSGATIDDGSCEYCGCTDPTAINYNPSCTADCIPSSCIYPPLSPPCIPPTINNTLNNIEVCIAENGTEYYNKLVTGKSDDCSIMNVWKLILMDYLLKKKGLECIYNCADANTPDASEVYISCDTLWRKGGPSTGLNDPIQTALNLANGTTQGTHSTLAMFDSASIVQLSPGDVIKHYNHPFNIWIFYGPQNGSNAPISVAGLDPENASGNISGYWGYCNDDMRNISNTNNINYIDNFINFANTFCRDCKNDASSPLTNEKIDNITTNTSQNYTSNILLGFDGIDGIDI